MKKLLKYFLFLSVLVIQSCEKDVNCAATSCESGNAVLEFKIVDSNTGEAISYDQRHVDVVKTSEGTDADFNFITENDVDILRINVLYTSAEYSILYGDEEIFTLSVSAKKVTEGCCSSTVLSDLNIEGADFEVEEDTGIYLIKKSKRYNLTTEEYPQNYHAFFENSKLRIRPDRNARAEYELLDIDVLEGEKLVFKLLTYSEGGPEIDDEETYIVYFEIDQEATEFTLNSDNFQAANAVIGNSASMRLIKYVTKGEINGKKISDDEWQLDVNVSADEIAGKYMMELEEPDGKTYNRSTYIDVWMPIYQTHYFK